MSRVRHTRTPNLSRHECPLVDGLCRSHRRLRQRDDRGSATVELVLGVGLLVLMFWFLIYCGRESDTRLRVEDAAHQAARAATLDRTASAAAVDAGTTAAAALSDAGVTCRSFTVTTSGSLAPGSTVTVTVTCTVGLQDLALLGVPGSATLSARFAAPVDVYRSKAHGIANSERPWGADRSVVGEQ